MFFKLYFRIQNPYFGIYNVNYFGRIKLYFLGKRKTITKTKSFVFQHICSNQLQKFHNYIITKEGILVVQVIYLSKTSYNLYIFWYFLILDI